MKKIFPEVYPKDLLDKIIEDGAKENTYYNVYRVSASGLNNRDAFLSSFLDRANIRDAYLSKKQDLDQVYDIGDFSTSLFYIKKQALNVLKCFEKYEDSPALLEGTITPKFGLSMYTRDSKSKRKSKSSHIDWWLYEFADPSKYFRIS